MRKVPGGRGGGQERSAEAGRGLGFSRALRARFPLHTFGFYSKCSGNPATEDFKQG